MKFLSLTCPKESYSIESMKTKEQIQKLNKDQFLKEVKELCIKYGISIEHGNKDVGYLNFKLVDYSEIYMADLMSAIDHTTK